MKKNQVKFSVDFVLTLENISDGKAKENYKDEAEKDFLNQSIVHQKSILNTLVENRELFKKYASQFLPYYAADEIPFLESLLVDNKNPDASSDILKSVIKTLPENSRKFFNEAEKKDLLHQSLELLFSNLSVKISGVLIE